MKLSRQQIVGLIVGVVAVVLVGYAISLAVRPNDPYAGLVLFRETEMDEATREYFTQRLQTTKAAIQAAEESGAEIDLNLYLSAASDAYSLGDLVQAREMLEKQLAGNSINFVAWNNYALVLVDMKDYADAEDAFKQTLEIDSTIEKYYADYADFLVTVYPERRDDLKALVEADLARNGQTVWNMVTLADWYAEAGECDRAVSHYKVAVVLEPKSQALKDDMAALEESCIEKDAN